MADESSLAVVAPAAKSGRKAASRKSTAPKPTAAQSEPQELQDLKEKLKMLEEKRDKRIPNFTPDHRAEARLRCEGQIAEVKAAIKNLTK